MINQPTTIKDIFYDLLLFYQPGVQEWVLVNNTYFLHLYLKPYIQSKVVYCFAFLNIPLHA